MKKESNMLNVKLRWQQLKYFIKIFKWLICYFKLFNKQQHPQSISTASKTMVHTKIQNTHTKKKEHKDLRAHMIPMSSTAIIKKNMSCPGMRQAMRTSGLQ